MGLFRVIIYGIIASVFAYCLLYDILYMPRIGHVWWIYKLVMLTMINLVLQTTYYCLCVVCAFMDFLTEKKDRGPHTRHPSAPSYWRSTKLHRACDFLYYTGAFPIGMITCILFWSLYVIDPNLVMPEWAHKLIPGFMKHITHTAPIPFILVDTLLTCHHAPKRKVGFIVSLSLAATYFLVILAVRIIDGYWLYPILESLSNFSRAMFLISSGLVLFLFYLIGDVLNTLLWGSAPHSEPVIKKRIQ